LRPASPSASGPPVTMASCSRVLDVPSRILPPRFGGVRTHLSPACTTTSTGIRILFSSLKKTVSATQALKALSLPDVTGAVSTIPSGADFLVNRAAVFADETVLTLAVGPGVDKRRCHARRMKKIAFLDKGIALQLARTPVAFEFQKPSAFWQKYQRRFRIGLYPGQAVFGGRPVMGIESDDFASGFRRRRQRCNSQCADSRSERQK